jgi:probable FeS assembly SUF system protein SufT
MSEPQRTTRAVSAVRIPSGELIHIPDDTAVVVTQALGDSFTILVPSMAGLYRLSGADADAIGQTIAPAAQQAMERDHADEAAVWEVLKTCYDPEIPVDIVNLGLVYGCEIVPDTKGSRVTVKMTLTAPGCGMGPVIAREAEAKICALPGVTSAIVEVVWDPPWSPDRITEEGRQKLGMA